MENLITKDGWKIGRNIDNNDIVIRDKENEIVATFEGVRGEVNAKLVLKSDAIATEAKKLFMFILKQEDTGKINLNNEVSEKIILFINKVN